MRRITQLMEAVKEVVEEVKQEKRGRPKNHKEAGR